MRAINTEEIIDSLVESAHGANGDDRAKFYYREALRGLVQLAKAEQRADDLLPVEVGASGQVLQH